ncbi:glycosyl hydrolase [Tritrichomonas foetus]|uniref:Glycosyl hydrolase n=1 Tax=Tritrichomonas foetus TaxID=1144522 RepID=A0A1J4KW13_9EUKA|nr:glycosyl hydrolase [Tritrichomonas foetus]|eukprot:OHT15427.1 glycosyl hydrolase [Tritrichomonas foetus]
MSSKFYKFAPVANRDAVIRCGHYRITVLTSKCIRIEYNEKHHFKDVPTVAFTVRDLPIPHHSTITSGPSITIDTDFLRLHIVNVNQRASKENLSVVSEKLYINWHYGDSEANNLKGTCRTLDMIKGDCPISNGLISTDGYAIVDDSNTPIVNEDGTFTKNDGQFDIYFFGYGHEYNECIKDFLKMSAQPPMLPKYAYGIWWSRYWAYTADEMLAIADDFLAHGVPLKVFVVDMDWHIVKNTGNESTGWTGYTFNNDLIPDPPELIRQLKKRGLKVTFNLHPADGIWPHEKAYPEFAAAMGVEPPNPVKFDCEDPKFMKYYFELLHHPLEEMGVDFWWIDWQQGTGHNVDPLIVLNHTHFMDSGRNDNCRPFILSRWCGLGGQRYPIGFSGDTEIEWESLQFQPYFTATSANVGFGFWSHDIGGHMGGHEDGELYVRWLQYGALSPILRMHSTSNPFLQRLPWQYDRETEYQAIRALKFHAELTPFFYSLGYQNHVNGLQPVRPLYYIAPEEESAYNCPSEFLLGDDVVVAPFVNPRDNLTNSAKTAVWLPDAPAWYDFQTGRQYNPGWHMIHGDLSSIPIFVRAGGIVTCDVKDKLVVHVFPLGNSTFELYEDDGISAVKPGFGHVTKISTAYEKDAITISFVSNGDLSHISENREILLKLRNVKRSAQITSSGLEVVSKKYRGEDCEITVKLSSYPCSIEVRKLNGISVDRIGFTDQMLFNFLKRCNINTWAKQTVYQRLTDSSLSRSQKIEILTNTNILEEEIRLELLSEYADFGFYHFIKETGKNVLVVWNTKHSKDFTYSLKKFPLAEDPKKPQKGTVPKALILDVEKNRTKLSLPWPQLEKTETRLELRINDTITRIFDFDKL